MYLVNGKASIIFTVVVVCLAFEAIMKYQVEQLNKIRVAATAIGIDEEAVKNWKVRDCMQLQLMTSVHLLILFSIYVTWKAKTTTNALPFNGTNRLVSV